MNAYWTTKLASFIAIGGCMLSGCAEMQVANPWARQEWADEEAKYGANFGDEIRKIQTTRSTAGSMSPADQQKTSAELVGRMRTESNPYLRREIARTLGHFKTAAAIDGLRLAVKDEAIDVRIAACEGWGLQGGKEAATQMARLIGSETNVDVRIAATAALANVKDPQSVNALGIALDDRDPALRYRAAQSLQSVTGKNFGSDFVAWREYIQQQAPVDSPAANPLGDRELIAREPDQASPPY